MQCFHELGFQTYTNSDWLRTCVQTPELCHSVLVPCGTGAAIPMSGGVALDIHRGASEERSHPELGCSGCQGSRRPCPQRSEA